MYDEKNGLDPLGLDADVIMGDDAPVKEQPEEDTVKDTPVTEELTTEAPAAESEEQSDKTEEVAAEEPAAETEPAACADGTIVVLYSAEERAAEAASVASADGTRYAYGCGDLPEKSGASRTLLPGKPPRLRPLTVYRKNAAPPDDSCIFQMQEGWHGRENTYRMTGRRSAGNRAAA